MREEQDLITRYCQTVKGRQIIAVDMISPIKLCRPIYKDEAVYHMINGELLNPEQVAVYLAEKQRIFRKNGMKKYNLTEDDMILSEENLEKIQQNERNV